MSRTKKRQCGQFLIHLPHLFTIGTDSTVYQCLGTRVIPKAQRKLR